MIARWLSSCRSWWVSSQVGGQTLPCTCVNTTSQVGGQTLPCTCVDTMYSSHVMLSGHAQVCKIVRKNQIFESAIATCQDVKSLLQDGCPAAWVDDMGVGSGHAQVCKMARKIQIFESAIAICKDAKTCRSKGRHLAMSLYKLIHESLCGGDVKHYCLSTGELTSKALLH